MSKLELNFLNDAVARRQANDVAEHYDGVFYGSADSIGRVLWMFRTIRRARKAQLKINALNVNADAIIKS